MAETRLIFKGIDLTTSVFRKVWQKLKMTTAKIFTMRAAFMAFGVYASGRLVSQNLKYADSIGKVADSIGISTKALQELRFAGEQSGITSQETDKALQKFSRTLGDLRNGAGALYTVFDKHDKAFAIQLKNTKNLDQAYNLFMKRLGEYRSEQDKASLAAAAFGRAGVKMVTMLKDGYEGMNSLREQARKLGLVLDDRVIRSSEKTNDKLNIMNKAIKVGFLTALEKAMPAIRDFADAIQRNAKEIGEFISGLVKIILWIAKVSKAVIKFAMDSYRAVKTQAEKTAFIYPAVIKKATKANMQGLMDSKEFLEKQLNKAVAKSVRQDLIRRINLIKEKMSELAAQELLDPSTSKKVEEKIEKDKKKKGFRSLGTQEKDKKDDESHINRFRKELARMDEQHATEIERLRMHTAKKRGIIEEAFHLGLISDQERKARIEELQRQHEDRMTKISKEGTVKRNEFEKLSFKNKVRFIAGSIARITSTAADSDKKMFKLNKIARIANAIMDTRAAATKALDTRPAWLGLTLAGIVTAAGFANVRAIASQQFSGGISGGGATPSGSGGVSSPAELGATIAETPSAPKTIILALPDDQEVVSKTWIRNSLIPAINEEITDGAGGFKA